MKARCPACRKLNTAHDKVSPIACGCGETFTPKFYRKNQAGATVFYCACGEVSLFKWKGNSPICARCLDIENRLESLVKPTCGFPFHALVTMVCHAEGFA